MLDAPATCPQRPILDQRPTAACKRCRHVASAGSGARSRTCPLTDKNSCNVCKLCAPTEGSKMASRGANKLIKLGWIGAGGINFGSLEGPWNHAIRMQKQNNVQFTAVVDPNIKAAQVIRCQIRRVTLRSSGAEQTRHEVTSKEGSNESVLAGTHRAVSAGTSCEEMAGLRSFHGSPQHAAIGSKA